MKFVRKRWALALLSLAASIWLMRVAIKISGIGAAGPVILSMVAFVSTVLLIAPEMAFWLGEQIAKPVANLLLPSEIFKKPPVSSRLVHRSRVERRSEEAVAHFEAII